MGKETTLMNSSIRCRSGLADRGDYHLLYQLLRCPPPSHRSFCLASFPILLPGRTHQEPESPPRTAVRVTNENMHQSKQSLLRHPSPMTSLR